MRSILRPARSFNVRNIAIIGAGPSGLAAAKYLLAEKAFERVDIFEQQPEVGGVWFYNSGVTGCISVPQITPHGAPERPIWPKGAPAPLFSNPMYDNLNTNIPKGLMQFSDQDFPSQSLLFPTREDVQEYILKYSQDVRSLITFSTQVQDVRMVAEDDEHWEVTAKSTITQKETTARYDAIIIANGHYSVPFIPFIPGIEAFNSAYPSAIRHSKQYRSPRPFLNQKVIVVGSGASGLDIGTQISHVCRKPLLNSVKTSSPLKLGQENKEEVSPIVEFLVKERGVRFEDGRVEKDIDAIIYCTGYLYSYPFLKHLDPPVVTDGRRVRGLHKQVFHITHPTLAFTALSQKVIPFPLSEVQGAAISKVWADKLDLPGKEEMEHLEKEQVEQLGDGTSFHVLGYPKDAEYINSLHDWVKTASDGFAKEPVYWDGRQREIREIYSDLRKKFVETGGKARTLEELGFEVGIGEEQVEEGRASGNR